MATFSEKRMFIRNWPLFIRPFRNFFLHSEVIAYLRSGLTLALRGTRSSDFYAMGLVIFEDAYHIGAIKDPKIILDVGANIGTFTVLVANKFPNARIIAVEPEPANIEQLKKNIELNRLSNVEIRQCAVGTSYGTARLYLDKERPSAHSLYREHVGSLDRDTFITVDTVPLSSFGKVDVLKIDVEGAEADILDGNIPDCQYVAVELGKECKDRIIQQFIATRYRAESVDSANCVFTRE